MHAMMVNGQLQQQISIADRGLLYGDGCFTTMAYKQSQLELFDAHLERLRFACDRLAIHLEDWSVLIEQVSNFVQSTQVFQQDSVIKIIITRGQGGRGYSPQGVSAPNLIISQHGLPQHYHDWQTTGIKLSQSPVNLALQPLLAGIKHLNRLEQVLIKQALLKQDFDDAIVCDTNGIVVESSVANVFWCKKDQWFTPSLAQCGVDGVMRNHIKALMQNKSVDLQVVSHSIDALLEADELFVCNSLMQVVPVLELNCLDRSKPKLFTQKRSREIQSWIDGTLTPSVCTHQ
jgi:4-amino-4-deoxychorismate lyase